MTTSTSPATDTTALLSSQEEHNAPRTTLAKHGNAEIAQISPVTVLPIALLAALAMAATAATTIYAYASLLCKDPTHCRDSEQSTYAGAVAAATFVANVCALFALGGFEKLSRKSRKAGLAVWLVCRSMSVAALALGVHLESIRIALSGQIFEGFASDNILHFSLNAIYVQSPDERQISRLIGTSLALYMIGISVSPTVAGLLANFQASFAMASIIFTIALLYLLLGVRTKQHGGLTKSFNATMREPPESESLRPEAAKVSLLGLVRVSAHPLKFFTTRPLTLVPGFALLLYNAAQSYLFPAIMVHTTVTFGFSSKENGFLISIAHAVSSAYLLFTLFIAPYIWQKLRRRDFQKVPVPLQYRGSGSIDAALAIFSLLMQALSITLFALASKPWQVYCTVALCALGLATPSFIKSYFITLFPSSDAPQALAALAVMETLGSLLAPLGLGGLQTLWPSNGVFFAAAICIGLASMLFVAGLIMLQAHHGLYNRSDFT